jgi:hypothetical protein
MNIFQNKYVKLVFVFGVAYLISNFSIKNVFLGNSPRINPYAGQNMIAKATNLWSKTTSLIAFKNPFTNSSSTGFQNGGLNQASTSISSDVAEALNTPLSKVSQGVYAGEKNDVKVFEVRIGEIEYLEYTFNIKGKEIKIKVPKGQDPPSQQVLEAVYK